VDPWVACLKAQEVGFQASIQGAGLLGMVVVVRRGLGEGTVAMAVRHMVVEKPYQVAASWAGEGAGRTKVAGLRLVGHQDMVAILVAQAGAGAKE